MLIVEQSKAKQNRLNNIQPNKQLVKHLPAMWETWVQSLGREDPLENETATHSVLLLGKSHGRGSLAGYSPLQRV